MSRYAIKSNLNRISDDASSAKLTALKSQLSYVQGQLETAQTALAQAQAQIVADAVTIASLQSQVLSLQGQVTSLQAQVTALQAQLSAFTLFKTYFVGSVTEVGGGIYVPPSYDNPVIFTDSIISPQIIKQVVVSSGGYP